jgi:hypothetical protein
MPPNENTNAASAPRSTRRPTGKLNKLTRDRQRQVDKLKSEVLAGDVIGADKKVRKIADRAVVTLLAVSKQWLADDQAAAKRAAKNPDGLGGRPLTRDEQATPQNPARQNPLASADADSTDRRTNASRVDSGAREAHIAPRNPLAGS